MPISDFSRAYDALIAHEGGYSNDPADRGGETYKGIARAFHPSWPGWVQVDACKQLEDFPSCLDSNTALDGMVREFYRAEFWDVYSADSLPHALAAEIFEQAVNLGNGAATRNIQRACNCLNRGGRLFANLAVDGGFGKMTLYAVTVLVNTGEGEVLTKVLNVLQGYRYVEIMERDESQERFARGWFGRVQC